VGYYIAVKNFSIIIAITLGGFFDFFKLGKIEQAGTHHNDILDGM